MSKITKNEKKGPKIFGLLLKKKNYKKIKILKFQFFNIYQISYNNILLIIINTIYADFSLIPSWYFVTFMKRKVYMVFFPRNNYQIVYLYFSVFQLVSTNCFSIFIYTNSYQIVPIGYMACFFLS